jgi:hypothetical protein
MIRFAIAVHFLPGCMAVSAKAQPSTQTSLVAGAAGVAIAGAALAGAHAASADGLEPKQPAAAIGTSLIPMAAIYLGEEPERATTPGGIYSGILGGIGRSLGAGLLFMAPVLGTVVAGDAESNGPTYGAMGGVLAGSMCSIYLGDHLPKWGRVVVGALVTGSAATLGYHLGDR